jgi:KaiC/GvpD/RAD55 family RecA-like ATPase
MWDDANAPTSVRLPTISPSAVDMRYFGEGHVGRIFQTTANASQQITVNATLTDAIGVYRFSTALLQFMAENGTTLDLPLNPQNATDYSTSYVVATDFNMGRWQVSLTLHDSSGNDYMFTRPFWVSAFYPVSIIVLDSDGSTLPNATLIVSIGTESFWSSTTNRTGWGALTLPSTKVVGPLNLTVAWLGTRSLVPLDVTGPSTVTVQLTVYATNLRVTLLNLPLPLARVTLYQTAQVGQVLTGMDGTARFGKLPAGEYTVTVEYLLAVYQTQIHLDQSGILAVPVPFPHRTATAVILASLIALASVVSVQRKRGKLYPASFSYFRELTCGGLPEACFAVIAGNSGSGKTVLLNSFAAEHLTSGNSIYITNTEYPEKIRDSITKLGVGRTAEVMDPKRLIFIDAYSAVGGSSSKEEYHVNSHTDLTNLGLNISKCLQSVGSGADVYMDSLSPLITVLRTDYLITFLQMVAARVKANNGRLYITIGTGIEERDLTKLEESADCVIETQLHETGGGQRRRLRIKKLRGKPYNDRWTRFRVEEGKGIVFLTHKKSGNPPTNNLGQPPTGN